MNESGKPANPSPSDTSAIETGTPSAESPSSAKEPCTSLPANQPTDSTKPSQSPGEQKSVANQEAGEGTSGTSEPRANREAIIQPAQSSPAPPTHEIGKTDQSPDKTVTTAKKSSVREFLDTVVFVVFLVLLLKTFVAEAFVIPTGSMAPTRLGNHFVNTCPQCGLEYFVGAGSETARRPALAPEYVVCPNCRHAHKPGWVEGGDKVLVLKPVYDFRRPDPQRNRHDTIVFKFPGWGDRVSPDQDEFFEGPTSPRHNQAFSPYNYIKRLWGFPGERLAIWLGDVYLATDDDKPSLTVIRKRPDRMLEMRQLVYDCDHEPRALAERLTRWEDDRLRPVPGSLSLAQTRGADHWQRVLLAGTGGLVAEFSIQAGQSPRYLRYEHRVPKEWFASGDRDGKTNDRDFQRRPFDQLNAEQVLQNPPPPQLITDFLAYNWTGSGWHKYSCHWVRDLLIECELEVVRAEGEVGLELIAGCDRYLAVWDLQTGVCQLRAWRDGVPLVLPGATRQETEVRRPGRFHIRFADFDQRLTVWVNDRLIFGEGVEVPKFSPDQLGPRLADLGPAAVMARQTEVKVRHLRLYRDIYYTQHGQEDIFLSVPDNQGQVRDQIDILSLKRVALTKYTDWARKIFQRSAAEKPEQYKGALPSALAALHRVRPELWAPYYPRGVITHRLTSSGAVDFGTAGSYPEPVFYPDRQNGGPKVFGPDEYFVLGDNSTSSQDSRAWGQVPERLLMGKAVVVYFPFWPFGSSRLGLIR